MVPDDIESRLSHSILNVLEGKANAAAFEEI